jgi:transcriptional regulator GlxA family with amidase domain
VSPGTRSRVTQVTGTRTRPVPVDLLRRLRLVRDHLDRHYARPLDLDELAKVAAVSKFHLVRSFEAAYGETPMRYLSRRRVERAQDLLRHANLTVTEICMLVGFSSLGSFSARFTELVGESPVAYRNRWAARGDGAHVPGCWLFMRGVLDLRGTAGPIEQSGRSDGAAGGPTVGA